MKLNIQCVNPAPARYMHVAGMSWFHGNVSTNRPTLAVCYENGKLQLMRNENDDCKFRYIALIGPNATLHLIFTSPVPIIVDTDMQAVNCLWNHDGSILAICGIRVEGGEKDTNVVTFYTPMGEVW